MIVRINQIDIARIETESGWPAGPYTGAIQGSWAADARAFELLILSQDEKHQPLSDDFRQHQLRHMIPQVAIALDPGSHTADVISPEALSPVPLTPAVVRLDGIVTANELLPAWSHLIEADGSGLFGFSPALKQQDEPAEALGSVRIVPSWQRLAALCNDESVGLERSVRLRLLAVPPIFIPELLEASGVDDPRWGHLLGECQFYLGTTVQLTALHLVVRRMDATQVKANIMHRLMAVARGEPAIPV